MNVTLLLEDGTLFEGKSFGAEGEKCGEVVFNTSMSGYQEILTDPSYHEQIVTMTYPLIGNYGINIEDEESSRPRVAGFIVKENCELPSNWRAGEKLSHYLKRNNIIGMQGIDTRMLVKLLRVKGSLNGIFSTQDHKVDSLKRKLAAYPGLVGRNIVDDVTTAKAYLWKKGVHDIYAFKQKTVKPRYKVVAYDFGIKYNILRLLVSHGCEVTVVPAATPAKEVLSKKPDGVFLSNGPGDPQGVVKGIQAVKDLLGKVPVFGICLGHQILTLALGGHTYKLKFGHRGANHPVKNLQTGKIEITSQNHGFCSDMKSLKGKPIELTHLNLNDNTVEGIRCKKIPAFSVQYHPEASPGPHDSAYLFNDFILLMGK
ncbi:MAG: carbamoyl phosphate synthase small subunit [Elusimicrobia bacterium RIFOXYB2_FULL_49_7]|nr:MAG: carbamoyl phosphate synthase small subunit [Elusimicrobia bacterium RIFOXYB2_FULL_49_7]